MPLATPGPVPVSRPSGTLAQRTPGTVRVTYCIGPHGRTHDLQVTESLDAERDAIALETIRTWTYRPATRDGVAIEQCTDARIEFRG